MKLASWNVNSLRMRLVTLTDWLKSETVDVCCLQETKVVDDDFPRDELLAAGYRAVACGQKTYNGVAVLTRAEMGDVIVVATRLPGDDDQKRFLHVRVAGLEILNVYVPNGSSVGSEKFAYKLAWLERLGSYVASTLSPSDPVIICGDFNIAPEDRDIYDADNASGAIMCSVKERAALGKLFAWGLSDTLRLRTQEAGIHSWWDFRIAAFRRKMGWRIDLILCTEQLAARCAAAGVDVWPCRMPKPSDHAPAFVEIAP